eukprot:TRINITY_DN9129_c0_g4_i1.p1 TRINITY_DN9129_c0_g4~~TRINITY_DN9129_c0_g4_i1.p1  ORF type:complete len:393 (+),score=78.62 TRINITY_DN9129_c0_g4_i1:120-1298(+)
MPVPAKQQVPAQAGRKGSRTSGLDGDRTPGSEQQDYRRLAEGDPLRWDQVAYGDAPSGPGRHSHAAAATGSTVFFFGGHDGVREHLRGEAAVCAVQLLPSVSWMPVALRQKGQTCGFARSQLCACSVEGKVYLVGGWDGQRRGHPVAVFDPAESTLAELETSGDSPCHLTFAACACVHTRIVVFGGCGKRTEGKMWMIDVQRQDDDAVLMWTAGAVAQAPSKRSSHAMAAVGQRVYVFGGRDADGGALSDLHCYEVDLASPSGSASCWVAPPALVGDAPVPRYGHAMAAVRSSLYVCGGLDASGKPLGDLYKVDVTAPAPVWQTVAVDLTPNAFPSPRAYHSLVAADSVLCLFGGRSDSLSPALGDFWTLETSLGVADGEADVPDMTPSEAD